MDVLQKAKGTDFHRPRQMGQKKRKGMAAIIKLVFHYNKYAYLNFIFDLLTEVHIQRKNCRGRKMNT